MTLGMIGLLASLTCFVLAYALHTGVFITPAWGLLLFGGGTIAASR